MAHVHDLHACVVRLVFMLWVAVCGLGHQKCAPDGADGVGAAGTAADGPPVRGVVIAKAVRMISLHKRDVSSADSGLTVCMRGSVHKCVTDACFKCASVGDRSHATFATHSRGRCHAPSISVRFYHPSPVTHQLGGDRLSPRSFLFYLE